MRIRKGLTCINRSRKIRGSISHERSQCENRNNSGNNPHEETEGEHSKPQLPTPFLAGRLTVVRPCTHLIVSIGQSLTTTGFLHLLNRHIHLLNGYQARSRLCRRRRVRTTTTVHFNTFVATTATAKWR